VHWQCPKEGTGTLELEIAARCQARAKGPSPFFWGSTATEGKGATRHKRPFGLGNHAPIVRQSLVGVVEHAAEGPVGIEVDARHRDLLDAQAQPGPLHPELERHAPASLGDL